MMISIEKREHPVWQDWKHIQDTQPDILTIHRHTPIVGQYQYLYTKGKITISLVELPNYFLDGIDYWEICGGGLTDDCERFDTKEEAETRIEELLGESIEKEES
jgi:hypothetical protein